MTYTTFLDEQVFANPMANVVCNRIYEEMLKSTAEVVLNTKFCLTGTAARIIQGASSEEIKTISFITDDLELFTYFGLVMSKSVGAQGAVILSESIQMKFNDEIFIELWYTDTMGTINTVTNLKVQDPADIPVHIN